MTRTDPRAWLEERHALADAARQIPWTVGEVTEYDYDGAQRPQAAVMSSSHGPITWDDHAGDVFDPPDAAFISDARSSVPAMAAALTAVLDLHPDVHGECHMCSDERGPKPFPCPTRRAVEAALGGEG
ncbi:hypothetical protein [Brevibacterium album]|uniref:hypothetical protein n=1 Tax=Brevibacterium album TaxID=417948 RepID=UPI000492046A|nr:hypothetical protein [Brevibacterium album]